MDALGERSVAAGVDVGDLGNLAEPIDSHEQPSLAVDLDERCGLAPEDVLAVPDRILRVVDTTLLDRALAQPGDDDLDVGDQADDRVEALVPRGQVVVEIPDLIGRARIAVQQEAAQRIRLLESRPDQFVRERVRDVIAGVDDALDLEAERRLVLDVEPEDVAGRDRGDVEQAGQPGGLGPLACAGRPDDEESGHRSRPS